MSWEMVKLGEIAKNLDSRRKPLNSAERLEISEEKLYPYIGANNIMGYVGEYLFDEEILCVAEDGGSWGKGQKCCNYYDEKCWVNNHAHVLGYSGKADLKFLMHYLNFTDLNQVITGTTRGKLTKSALESIKVPLPKLPVQKQIVEILDKADTLRNKDKQLLQYYDDLTQSLFIDMFGDPVRNEKGWRVGTIRDLCTEVKYGTSKPALEGGKCVYLRMNNITYSGGWDFKDLKYINLDSREKEKYCLKKGDVVFNRTNSKELVGKTAVYNREDEMAIAGYLIRVRTNELANPQYISAFLNSKYGKAILKDLCKNIIGMANINAQELQNISIPIVPNNLQNEFATQIENIERQKEKLKAQMQESENLFQALLQKAFSGGLD